MSQVSPAHYTQRLHFLFQELLRMTKFSKQKATKNSDSQNTAVRYFSYNTSPIHHRIQATKNFCLQFYFRVCIFYHSISSLTHLWIFIVYFSKSCKNYRILFFLFIVTSRPNEVIFGKFFNGARDLIGFSFTNGTTSSRRWNIFRGFFQCLN